jgi:RNA polymerase primary sigma factor
MVAKQLFRATTSDSDRVATVSALRLYLRDVNRLPSLTAAEVHCLAIRIRQGDREARDQLVRANLRLVLKVASWYRATNLSLLERVAEGNLGLVRAAERYDASRYPCFSTYAVYWIRRFILEAAAATSGPFRLPPSAGALVVRWRRAEARLRGELGRPPRPEETARVLGHPVTSLKAIEKVAGLSRWLPGEHETNDFDAVYPDRRFPPPDDRLAKAEEEQRALELLCQLEERQATVLRMRFGLHGNKARTLEEVGARLGLTRERVRQIEVAALQKLREEMGRDRT